MPKVDNKQYIKKYRNQKRLQKIKSLIFVSPLLAFLIIFFITPIGFVLYKGFYNPTVSNISPNLANIMQTWKNIDELPDETIFKVVSYEIKKLQKERVAGKLAEEVNRRVSQTGSVIKHTARKLNKTDLDEITDFRDLLISINPKWGEIDIWHGLRAVSNSFSLFYYANAFDYEQTPKGEFIKKDEDNRVYLPILWRTFVIAALVTLLTFLLGYPLAYYLSIQPPKVTNILLIFVLLPFWTSLLVRTTSWIAILQQEGVVNKTLITLGVINSPLDILYNQFSTVLAMTHILLPFMVLPLYSVMKGIDYTYVKAAQSLGANPFYSFIGVYFPLTIPGLSAGALLVFIISVGYYITPALLGGVDGQMISNLVAYHMRTTNNWELAAALGTILLVMITIFYIIYDRLFSSKVFKL